MIIIVMRMMIIVMMMMIIEMTMIVGFYGILSEAQLGQTRPIESKVC